MRATRGVTDARRELDVKVRSDEGGRNAYPAVLESKAMSVTDGGS